MLSRFICSLVLCVTVLAIIPAEMCLCILFGGKLSYVRSALFLREAGNQQAWDMPDTLAATLLLLPGVLAPSARGSHPGLLQGSTLAKPLWSLGALRLYSPWIRLAIATSRNTCISS